MYLRKTAIEAGMPELGGITDLEALVKEIAITTTLPKLGETTKLMDSLLTSAGRATIRAKAGTKATSTKVESTTDEAPTNLAEVVMETTESLEGEESYARPNGDLYYGRKWGDNVDVEVLRKAREAGQFVMLYGSPGTGKTAMVEAAFPDELYTILGSGDTEVSDLVGGYVQTPSGGFEWVDGVLTRAASEGKVLLIDEIGLIDPKVLSVVYGLMDGRKELVVTANPERGVVKAQEGFYVVSATNPNVAGVRLSEALLSRFSIQVEMTTDWALARKLGVPQTAVVASQNLSKKMENGETSWSPQMRELLAFRDLSKMFGTKWAVQNLLASAPEIDRAIASDVFTRVFGEAILPAKI
jgi:SpoVK/Ycf46/Vps4 family AAA+-type ATPase